MVVTIRYTFEPTVSHYFADFDHIKAFEPLGCLTTFPVFIFSFTTQINLLQCFEELEIPTIRRMHKVLAKQHFICFSIYLFIGVFGYLSFPIDDPSYNSYIVRYDAIRNIPVLIAVVLLILVIYVAQPFNSLPCRESLEYFLCGSNKEPSGDLAHYSMAVVMHVVVTACACLCIVNKINMDSIITYFSTASSTFVAYIFPFGFFLNTFTHAYTRTGKILRRFIEVLYYGFWVFQIASIIGLFLPTPGS